MSLDRAALTAWNSGIARARHAYREDNPMIDVPEPPPRRTDRKVCTDCEATPGACRSREWLTGRRCCGTCGGNHDERNAR